MKTWRILKPGRLDKSKARKVEFTCTKCGKPSLLSVNGLPIAQVGQGLVFEPGSFAMPARCKCPECRTVFEIDGGENG